jgi:glycosyltransferase involved in cell wall biosynthesis
LRALFIGNIANNSYLNASVLRSRGVHADVLCYDYYHAMGYPEWEECDFEAGLLNQSSPDWTRVHIAEYQRPSWFAQGPLPLCVDYLIALNLKHHAKAEHYLGGLRRHWINPSAVVWQRLPIYLRPQSYYYRASALLAGIRRHGVLRKAFAQLFPDREDRYRWTDMLCRPFPISNKLSRLLGMYDVVVGCSIDGAFPLTTGKSPYIAYEHGTIRSIPFEPTPLGRVCALTYRMADMTLITNCDNIEAAHRLGVERYMFMPHPVNEDHRVEALQAASLRRELRDRLAADFVVFHPSRQHWESERHPSWEKGNDVFIKGFARFVKEVCPRAAAVFVEWGKTVNESKRLLAELGVADRVHWVAAMPNRRMVEQIAASDVVADQFFLGAFGSTTPKALFHGRPAMLYLDESRHRWCFPETPPVINARTPEEVFQGLSKLYREPAFQAEIQEKGRAWYDRYHSNRVIVERFSEAFKRVLGDASPRTVTDPDAG